MARPRQPLHANSPYLELGQRQALCGHGVEDLRLRRTRREVAGGLLCKNDAGMVHILLQRGNEVAASGRALNRRMHPSFAGPQLQQSYLDRDQFGRLQALDDADQRLVIHC